ncbi:FdhF/YdeP family oxidoreductase [Oligoflexus tunisiensis]|uniref:FdhF/YdeP family oxidoreductase n=1 Tax=Oligoflexus tunisiensis TaxID=708132 RepID=UPI000AF733A2|nr:FdhF/YdeP family oxidoreductase [Oligoflexus tunisiensis]
MKKHLDRRFSSFVEMGVTAWENRDNLGYAMKLLKDGVCDGCALGTSGVKDWTIPGIHLCWIRLNLLRLNTMPALKLAELPSIATLQSRNEKELRALGRIAEPMIREPGDTHLRRLSWDEALHRISQKIRASGVDRTGFYLVSRGTVNETYYACQKAVRFLGSNDIDNSARICHAPSTVALKQMIGYGATTFSYQDMLKSDLLVFIGSNAANNQPVLMKYLHVAKKNGAKIVTINPYREPGMEKYWVPSVPESALLGTVIADASFEVRVGGDAAFMNGVIKYLIERDSLDHDFIRKAEGWQELEAALAEQSWEFLEKSAGCSRESMRQFAEIYEKTKSAIFVWSMGVTMHKEGVDNVRSVVNLALARGNIGKPGSGLMPIRGHSGVQGGGEMGATPNALPGGVSLSTENRERFERLWGFPVPAKPGRFIVEMIDAAARGELDVLYCIGSNLFGVLPDPHYVRKALENLSLRVHHDIVLNPQMLVPSREAVIILPATTRYEMVGGNTETSTERRVIFNPELGAHRIPEARDEWRVLIEVAERVKPDGADEIQFDSTAAIRDEIARAVPIYEGIQKLRSKGDQFQWGGPMLCENGKFATPDGKAHFVPVKPRDNHVPEGWFQLTNRRGKQFNSMAFRDLEPLAGARRHEVILSEVDMAALQLKPGDLVQVKSASGMLEAAVKPGRVRPQTVIAHWPESNVLIQRGRIDPECGIPAFRDELVQVIPLRPALTGTQSL